MRFNDHENTPADYRRARVLRNNASPVEQKLWPLLRENAALRKMKFRRQHVIHPYIADFACLQARLLIELDGASHDTKEEADKARESYLQRMGYNILRFSNAEVFQNPEGVVTLILNTAEKLLRKP